MNSGLSRLDGGGFLQIPAVPSGSQGFTTPVNGKLFIRTDAYNGNPANTLYKYNGSNWDVMGPVSNFAGDFDTLYIVNFNGYNPDDSTLANMKLANLNANAVILKGLQSDPESPTDGTIWLRTN
jgi:hypothetical protein